MEDKDRVSSDGWALSFSEHANQKLHWEDLDMPLLEDLIRALSRSNQSGGKIERINDLVQRLKRTQEGQDIIPPEFDSLWQIIMQASRELS